MILYTYNTSPTSRVGMQLFQQLQILNEKINRNKKTVAYVSKLAGLLGSPFGVFRGIKNIDFRDQQRMKELRIAFIVI